MQNKQLPLSPHLQVHHWYFTMFLSILHRATGVAISAGAILMCAWLMAAAAGETSFAAFQEFTHSLIGRLMLFGWLFAYAFHFLNGMRHLVWDWGYNLKLKDAQTSGMIVFALAFVVTCALWFFAG